MLPSRRGRTAGHGRREGARMKIKTILWEMGNDFRAIMACEHCGNEQDNRSGYHDNYYHTQVIPAMRCKECGKNREGKDADAMEKAIT